MKKPFTRTLRCYFCGRFTSYDASRTHYPFTPIDALEPAEPQPICERCDEERRPVSGTQSVRRPAQK